MVQLTGVYLIFASLIMPVLAVRRLPQGAGLVADWVADAAGHAADLVFFRRVRSFLRRHGGMRTGCRRAGFRFRIYAHLADSE